MHWGRTVTLGVACGAIAVWLAAAATSIPSSSSPIISRTPTPVEVRGAELASEISRLRERLRPTATPLQRRDLFRYHRAVVGASRPESSLPAAALPVAEATAIAQPSLALVGLAEDNGPDGPIRTAIISHGGELFLVKEGEAVTSQYRVATISADVVELTDTSAGTPLRLALR
jgi:hypothetical protein